MVFAENDPKGPKIDQNGPHHIFFIQSGLKMQYISFRRHGGANFGPPLKIPDF